MGKEGRETGGERMLLMSNKYIVRRKVQELQGFCVCHCVHE